MTFAMFKKNIQKKENKNKSKNKAQDQNDKVDFIEELKETIIRNRYLFSLAAKSFQNSNKSNLTSTDFTKSIKLKKKKKLKNLPNGMSCKIIRFCGKQQTS